MKMKQAEPKSDTVSQSPAYMSHTISGLPLTFFFNNAIELKMISNGRITIGLQKVLKLEERII